MLERAQEIIAETTVQELINPFDSDYIDDNKENNVDDILQEDKDKNENNTNDAFTIRCILLIKKYFKNFFSIYTLNL